jgi:hypothetical protein
VTVRTAAGGSVGPGSSAATTFDHGCLLDAPAHVSLPDDGAGHLERAAAGREAVLLGARGEEGADLLADLVEDVGPDLHGQLQGDRGGPRVGAGGDVDLIRSRRRRGEQGIGQRDLNGVAARQHGHALVAGGHPGAADLDLVEAARADSQAAGGAGHDPKWAGQAGPGALHPHGHGLRGARRAGT